MGIYKVNNVMYNCDSMYNVNGVFDENFNLTPVRKSFNIGNQNRVFVGILGFNFKHIDIVEGSNKTYTFDFLTTDLTDDSTNFYFDETIFGALEEDMMSIVLSNTMFAISSINGVIYQSTKDNKCHYKFFVTMGVPKKKELVERLIVLPYSSNNEKVNIIKFVKSKGYEALCYNDNTLISIAIIKEIDFEEIEYQKQLAKKLRLHLFLKRGGVATIDLLRM